MPRRSGNAATATNDATGTGAGHQGMFIRHNTPAIRGLGYDEDLDYGPNAAAGGAGNYGYPVGGGTWTGMGGAGAGSGGLMGGHGGGAGAAVGAGGRAGRRGSMKHDVTAAIAEFLGTCFFLWLSFMGGKCMLRDFLSRQTAQ